MYIKDEVFIIYIQNFIMISKNTYIFTSWIGYAFEIKFIK